MSEEIKFDLDGDIIMQIEMDSYMKYNDTIASMNDHLGEIYGYSDVRDTEEAQLKYEKELAYKAIVQLQQKVEEKNKEIDRLNNILDETRLSELHKEYIINELEKYLIEHIDEYRDMEQDAMFEFELVLDKLKSLKENK